MYITASAPNQKTLGAVNGLSQTTASTVRAIGPALATSMFAYSVEHNLLGGYAVYLVMIAITLATSRFGAMLPVEPGKYTLSDDSTFREFPAVPDLRACYS
jgi:hypothetical protein